MCNERGQSWDGDAPKCPFDSDIDDNWMCATLNKIRDVCEMEHPAIKRGNSGDENFCYIDISMCSDEGSLYPAFALWVNWYKRRARTDCYLILGDDGARPATEKELLEVIKYFDTP